MREGGKGGWGRGGRVGQRGQKEILPEGGIDQMYWSQWRWGIEEGAGGRGRAGQRGGRKFYLGAELIKCIDLNEGEALRRGAVEGAGGGGEDGREGNFTWGWNWSNVLIQMKVRHWGGGPPSNLGVWRPLPLCSTAYGGGGEREGGGREDIGL